jgi:zinc transport system ATP-binding protein
LSLISVKNLAVGYNKSSVAKDIAFVVNAGDYLCIIGENGAGKSTLIKTLLGLQNPISGEIKFNAAKKEFGYLPQQREVKTDFPANVGEIVMSGALNSCGLRPWYNRRERERAAHYIEALGIKNLTKQCFRELSGGQQQRVLLARALVSAKTVLFMDEPDTGLDPIATKEMYETVARLNETENLTIVTISHDTEFATDSATHILRVCKCGKCDFFTKAEFIAKGGVYDHN